MLEERKPSELYPRVAECEERLNDFILKKDVKL